ncbi:hypothetical protein E3P84_01741 [Wallemia ichthyophaga]|nr:hypothetical protein E3P84_01741 [Wallemia ichthyophaga]
MSTPYYQSAYQDSTPGLNNAPYSDDPMSNEGFKYAGGGAAFGGAQVAAPKPWYKKKKFLVSYVDLALMAGAGAVDVAALIPFFILIFNPPMILDSDPIGIPAVIAAIIIACVVGGVVGSRNDDDNSNSNANNAAQPSPSDAAQSKLSSGRFSTDTNDAGVPIYGNNGTNSKLFQAPTFLSDQDDELNLPTCDESPPSFDGDGIQVTTDRPRIGGVAGRWECLKDMIDADAYMSYWNQSIFDEAQHFLDTPAPAWIPDGGLTGSGVLDQARECQMAVKSLSYAYRMTKDDKYKDGVWDRLQVIGGVKETPAGTDEDSKTYGSGTEGETNNWNPKHFLDTAEFMNSFAIGYDWLYDSWSQDEKDWIRDTLVTYGLNHSQAENNYWWRSESGNWNCVCNGGMINSALSIWEDDTSGLAEQILNEALENAKSNCVYGAREDGTWTETSDYWYFGTTGWSLATSSLIASTGNEQGMLTTNPNFYKTADFHMYNFGNQAKFDYGDTGPNKYTATANALVLLGRETKTPEYMLYQRDRADATDAFNMLWYDPHVAGAWWNNMPLDRYFDDSHTQWASFRSSWTDNKGLFAAIKAGNTSGHQTHGDLDVGDFVIDALGQRWAGELGAANYLGENYFNSEAQDAERWQWYRKGTEGQNVLLYNNTNSNAGVASDAAFGTSNTTQGATMDIDIDDDSTGFYTSDITSSYYGNSVKRGLRLLNKRRQILLQDDIDTDAQMQWRIQTNATISLNGQSADLELNGEKMTVRITNPSYTDLEFGQEKAEPDSSDELPENGEGENAAIPNVDSHGNETNVLTIDIPAGSYSLQISFEPQWDGMSSDDFQTPKNVAIDDWSLRSHDA